MIQKKGGLLTAFGGVTHSITFSEALSVLGWRGVENLKNLQEPSKRGIQVESPDPPFAILHP